MRKEVDMMVNERDWEFDKKKASKALQELSCHINPFRDENVAELVRVISYCMSLEKALDKAYEQVEVYYYYLHPPAYKFEDLKPNMWLWNDKRKRCFRLTDAFIRAGTKYYRWLDLSSGKLVRERFVEGQLYPPTKAMEYQEGN